MKSEEKVGSSDGVPNSQRHVNHILGLRNHLCAPGESPQMMTGVTVVPLNTDVMLKKSLEDEYNASTEPEEIKNARWNQRVYDKNVEIERQRLEVAKSIGDARRY